METLRTIRHQLADIEEAYRERRLRDVMDMVVTLHDLADVLASAMLSEQLRSARQRLDQLADLDLVIVDLEAKLERALNEPMPTSAAQLLEEVWGSIQDLLGASDDSNRLLLRTNIFPRGKKAFVAFHTKDTLKEVATVLKARYATQIAEYLKTRGAETVVPEAVDIMFFGSSVWERPDEAMLAEYSDVSDIVKREKDGILWFPVLPGDSPIRMDDEEDDDDAYMSILENFTIEADVTQLEAEIQRLASKINPVDKNTAKTSWRSKAYFIKDEATDREERIPLIGERISVGRGRENDIQILNDTKVSRFHCRILREGEHYFMEDNSSSNGTVVNGEMIHRRQLTGGERVEIGNTIFRFLLD